MKPNRTLFKSNVKRAALSVVSVLALACAVPAVAQDTTHSQQTKEFNVPSMPLDDSIRQIADQSGVQIVVYSNDATGITAPALEGEFTTEQALDKVLAGAEFEYRRVNDRTIAVAPPSRFVDAKGASLGEEQAPAPFRVAQVDQGESVRDTVTREEVEGEARQDVIVVTGTNIRGVSPDSSPSFTYDKDDIDKSGFGTVAEFVDSLPQNFGGGAGPDVPFLPNDRQAGTNRSAGSSVNLRGLGSGSTLTLLNGSRLAPSGSVGDFVDISMIPLSAVERIEVLTDGASAVYGADAVAGVVNFVLRDDYDGAETFVRVGQVTEGDLTEIRAGQTFGTSWDSGNAIVSYEYYDRENLGAEDRDFASETLLPENLLPAQTSHNLLLAGAQQLNNRVRLRGHGTFSQRDSDDVFTSSTGSTTTFDDYTTTSFGGMAGLSFALTGDWQLDASGSYHKNEESGELLRVVNSTGALRESEQEIESDLWSLDGKIDGTIFSTNGGDAKIAVGLSYREESFSNENGVVGSVAVSNEEERNVFSAFSELYVPLVGSDNRSSGLERLELTIAARYDEYSDFGDTINPKVGLLWSPVSDLVFRGTYSTSFNPPNLGDIGQVGGQAFVRIRSNPASPTGTSIAIIDGRGNPDLQPEESTAWTAGVDYSSKVGQGDLDLSLTWFNISYTDRIGDAGPSTVYLNSPDVFADVITADPDLALVNEIINTPGVDFFNFSGGAWTMPGDEEFLLDARILNLAALDTSGIDASLAYSLENDSGLWTFGLNGSYLLDRKTQITSGSPVFDVVGTIFNPVDLRLRGNASWSRDGLAVSVFVNYTDSYVDDRDLLGTGDVDIDAWTTVDFNLSYDTEERTGSDWIDNTTFTLSVLNLFNEDPPSVINNARSPAPGYDPTNASPLGRFVSFQITKQW